MAAANNRSVFETGCFSTVLLNIAPQGGCGVPPPKPLLIASPSSSDGPDFPVLLLLHGYLLYNTFYSQLISHIASHGFIVIAPQLYSMAGPDSTEEVKALASIIDWLSKGLSQVLPPKVKPNLHKLTVSGHSRGGKVTFAFALKRVASSPLKISGFIGIDPVDGMDKGKQTPPAVLTYVPHSFDLDDGAHVLIIGSGLGSARRNPLFPPCAPSGVNHADFFDECRGPAYYFVAKDYGHVDMLDDETRGFVGKATGCLCKNGKSRKPMRRFVGGIVVAFLRACLDDDYGDLDAIREGRNASPVEFDKVGFKTAKHGHVAIA
ncbi:hypothetical protein V2J09_006042 [Rumex salicifolius]